MLSPDLTRSQSELDGALRAESLVSPLSRLWALAGRRRRDRSAGAPFERPRSQGAGHLEQLPSSEGETRGRVTLPAA